MSDRFGNIPIGSDPVVRKGATKKNKNDTSPPSSPSQNRKGTSSSPKPLLLWVILLVVLFSIYSALGFLGVPYYLTNLAPEHFNEKTGLTFEAGKITFNPFSFRLEAQDSRILSNTGENIGSVQAVLLDLAPLPLLRQDLVCHTLNIDGLALNIIRDADNNYNIAQLYGSNQRKLPTGIMQFSDLPFFFSLNNIVIKNSRLLFTDLPTKQTHTVEEIRLDLPTFSNIPYQETQYIYPQFSAVVNGSLIELSGDAYTSEISGSQLATKLAFEVHALTLPSYAEYLPFTLPFALTSGNADGNIELFFDPRKTKDDTFSIGFDLQIRDVAIENHDSSISIFAPSVALSGTLQPASKKIRLSNVIVKSPELRSFDNSFLQNSSQFFHTTPSSAPSAHVDKPFSLHIDLAIIDNGTTQFFDSTESKTPQMSWNSLQFSLKKYSSLSKGLPKNDSNSFRFSGAQDKSLTTFFWQGRIQPPHTMQGELQISKMRSSDIFNIFTHGESPQTTGLGDLHGTMILQKSDNKATPIIQKVINAEVEISDFALMEGDTTTLSAGIATCTDAHFEEKQSDLGQVYLQNATINLNHGAPPAFFSPIISGEVKLHGLHFEGKANIHSISQKKPDITATELTIKAHSLSGSAETENNISISSKTDTGGTFLGSGSIKLTPFSLTLSTGFNTLPLQSVLPLFTTNVLSKSFHGILAGKGTLKLPEPEFEGELQIQKGSALHNPSTPFTWKNASLKNVVLKSEPLSIHVSSLDINNLNLLWRLSEKDNYPTQHIAHFIQEQIGQSTTKQKVPELNIDTITWKNSSIQIVDTRLQPHWEELATHWQGEIHDIQTALPQEKTIFAFTAQLGGASINSSGNGRFFSSEPNGTTTFTLKNGSLSSFGSQLQPLATIDASASVYDLLFNSKWQDGIFRNTGSIHISNLEPVHSQSETALALALMADADNTITLPYTITRNRPIGQEPLFEELLSQFQTRMVKSSVSPLLLTGKKFSTLIDRDFVDCTPGETGFSKKYTVILAHYAELLKDHPHIALLLTGTFNKEIDVDVMKARRAKREEAIADTENEKSKKEWQRKKELYEQKVEKLMESQKPGAAIVEEDIPSEVLAGFTPKEPAAVIVTHENLIELANQRAVHLRQYFISDLGLEPNRIIARSIDALKLNNESTEYGVRIQLSAVDSREKVAPGYNLSR